MNIKAKDSIDRETVSNTSNNLSDRADGARSTAGLVAGVAAGLVMTLAMSACGGGSGSTNEVAGNPDSAASQSASDPVAGISDPADSAQEALIAHSRAHAIPLDSLAQEKQTLYAHISATDAEPQVHPQFHAAPILIAEPDLQAASGLTDLSRQAMPLRIEIPQADAAIDTKTLSAQMLSLRGIAESRARISLNPIPPQNPTQASDQDLKRSALAAAPIVAVTHTPASIRKAYGLPALETLLPAAGKAMTAEQAALMGAGQTIYVMLAHHNPNQAAELSAFNKRFGLPECTFSTIGPTTALPLTKPATGALAKCEVIHAFMDTSGNLTNQKPSFNAEWATEAALDLQWAHAIAPMARIVLVQTPSPTISSLGNAVKNLPRMGPGIVNFSLGTPEGSWSPTLESIFAKDGMVYVAAAGDFGVQANWPAASANVLAVGGTSLNILPDGTRNEQAWSRSGGGMSQFFKRPAFQSTSTPGLATDFTGRAIPDVALNSDPRTGQLTAVTANGQISFMSGGGTSVASPQWSGLLAIANAMRQLKSSDSTMSMPLSTLVLQNVLYGDIASKPANYSASFLDVLDGFNGSCATCKAQIGHDRITGLGTPNSGQLTLTLTGLKMPSSRAAQNPATPPTTQPPTTDSALTITGPTKLTGQTNAALKAEFSVAIKSATNSPMLSIGVAGMPSGMVGSITPPKTPGQAVIFTLSWPTPRKGTYTIGLSFNLSGSSKPITQTLTITIA